MDNRNGNDLASARTLLTTPNGLGRNTNRCGPCQEVEPSMQEFCMIASIMSRKS